MPKKIIDDSDSSSESEPEQYDKIVNDTKPKVKIIKLEKPKRVMSEKQLENLKRGRENRVKARQEKHLQEKQLQETPAPAPADIPTPAPTASPTPAPAVETIKEQKKPLSKLNKKQLKIEADLLNIDINNLTNAQIIKKIRELQGVNGTQEKSEKSETLKIDSPKKKNKVKETIKEIHHHHYKDEEKAPKIKNQIEETTPSVTIKKETKIINFV
tara:strand:+ start:604 stop:1245 length:642 start_codon:yes stop_codon:yes gene_type:complete